MLGMERLSNLYNIGNVLEKQLIQVGVTSLEQLVSISSKEAWLKIKEIDDSACINRLYALEGAIRGIKKSELPQEVKMDLKEFYQIHR